MSTDYHSKAAAEQEKLAEQVQAIEHELRTNPEYQSYFAGYLPASVEEFIRQYARRKVSYQQQGPKRLARLEAEATAVRDVARQRLWDIQQKKLFDLQCRWRAGLIRLPEVDVSEQFEYWCRHPQCCPFLPPITPEEFALYCEYVASPESIDGGWADGGVRRQSHWQDYMTLRSLYYEDELPHLPADSHVFQQDDEDDADEDWDEEDDDDEEEDDWDDDEDDEEDKPRYPAWYRFYDQRHDTGPLRHLPNVRGMREQHYRDLYIRDWAYKDRAERAAAATADPIPAADECPAPELDPTNSLSDEAEPEITAAAGADAVAEETTPTTEPAAAPQPAPDTRPYWHHYNQDELFRTIVENFDPTHQLLELRRAMKEGQNRKFSLENDQALYDFHDLAEEHHIIVPIEAPAADWREALRPAVREMRRRQLLAVLPLEYEDYRQRLALGLQPAAPGYEKVGDPQDDWQLGHIEHRREQVLRGRVLSGEPENFDF